MEDNPNIKYFMDLGYGDIFSMPDGKEFVKVPEFRMGSPVPCVYPPGPPLTDCVNAISMGGEPVQFALNRKVLKKVVA